MFRSFLLDILAKTGFNYSLEEDHLFIVSCDKGEEVLWPHLINIDLDYADDLFVIFSLIKSRLSAGMKRRIERQMGEEGFVEYDFGSYQFAEGGELIYAFALDKTLILADPKAKTELLGFFNSFPEFFAEKLQWCEENLLAIDYDFLMEEGKGCPSSLDYYRYDCGEGMIHFSSKETDQHFLVNSETKEVFQLVNESGDMVAFTEQDVDQSVIDQDVESNNAKERKSRYDFRVYSFKDGLAEVEWIVYPDGRYFADEDGFGAESNPELAATAIIDKHGKLVKPFTVKGQ